MRNMKPRPEPLNLYHRDSGFPVWFDRKRYESILPDVLTGVPHYVLTANGRNLPRRVERTWVQQADFIEVQCSAIDNAVLRYLVRGHGYVKSSSGRTIPAQKELSIVINASTGMIVTGWWNNEDDQHRLTSERSQEYVK